MILAVLGQLVDFLLKAAYQYMQTPEGQKEWRDVENAAKGVDLE